RGERRVGGAMKRDVLAIQTYDTLDVALEQLTSHRIGCMPVVEVETATGGRHLIGRISTQEIVRAYREALAKGSRRMRGLVEGTVMLEAEIETGIRLAGRPLREAQLPTESLDVSIRLQDGVIYWRGGAVVE